jgi:hypothetical protein
LLHRSIELSFSTEDSALRDSGVWSRPGSVMHRTNRKVLFDAKNNKKFMLSKIPGFP